MNRQPTSSRLWLRRLVAVSAGTLVAAGSLSQAPAAAETPAAAAPPAPIVQADDPVPGQYIVTLQDTPPSAVPAVAEEVAGGGEVLDTYASAISGFTAELTDAEARAVAADPAVAAIEEDAVVRLDDTQSGAPWGLDRVDQRVLPLDSTFSYHGGGAGVTAYVLDTGIRPTHVEFGGRASVGADFVGDGRNGIDCQGHGTHVAGTVGGATYGVAKAVRLVAVRVLGCDGQGTVSGVVAGVDWVVANHAGPSVMNMSLGGAVSASMEAAVDAAVTSGVTVVVAGGNANADACTHSPADVAAAMTVGATDRTDTRATYSNHGDCLDLFAPGTAVLSAGIASDTATRTLSGTSMATPHVTGAAALSLEQHPGATPAQLAAELTSAATAGQVRSPGSGSPNLLLYTGDPTLPSPPSPPAHTAAITVTQDSSPDAPQAFTFTTTGTGLSDFSLVDRGPSSNRSRRFGDLAPGTYTVTQASAAPTGWRLTGLSCTTGSSTDLARRRVTITLAPGEVTDCTFTDTGTAPANDDLSKSETVSGTSGTGRGHNSLATGQSSEPRHAGRSGGSSVWYRWTAPRAGFVTFDTEGSGFDTLLGTYTGSTPGNLVEVASNDDGRSIAPQSQVRWFARKGVQYRIAVDGAGGTQGAIRLSWSYAVGD